MIFKSTNEALAHALVMTEAERDHIQNHYDMIHEGLRDLIKNYTPEQQTEKRQFIHNTICRAQFLKEAVQEFDRIQDEDRINSLKLEVIA